MGEYKPFQHDEVVMAGKGDPVSRNDYKMANISGGGSGGGGVTLTDLLTFYSVIITQLNSGLKAIDATDTDGNYSLAGNTDNTVMASTPVKRLDVPADSLAVRFYFVARSDFDGIYIAGEKVPMNVVTMGGTAISEGIKKDEFTFYLAEVSGSSSSVNVKRAGLDFRGNE